MTVGRSGSVPTRIRWIGRVSGAHLVVLLAGLFGGVLTLAALRADARDVGVLVAARDMRVGARIDASDVRTVVVHGDVSNLGTLLRGNDAARAVGSVVVAPLRRGEPLRNSDISAQAASGGARAVTFAVDESDALAGALGAGDRIDVVAVAHDGSDAGYVLVDAPVLAVSAPRGSGPLHSSDGRLDITVASSGDDALRLVGALTNARVVVVNATGATPLAHAPRYPLPTGGDARNG